jgi:sulfite exporter TauE/SafE
MSLPRPVTDNMSFYSSRPSDFVAHELSYGLAFSTGVLGALHCLGMCGGLAAGCATACLQRPTRLALLQYHGSRLALYMLFGSAGAVAGRALVQTGIVGKVQGVLMIGAGLLVVAIGLRLLWQASAAALPRPFRAFNAPALGGLLNGLVPCSLVFSVAVPAAATAEPLRAALMMLAFGLGTLPTMATISWLGGTATLGLRGYWLRLVGFCVILLGAWTTWEGWVFFDIMRGLANW